MVKVMSLLLSVDLTLEFLCKANNNKYRSYTYPYITYTKPVSVIEHTHPAFGCLFFKCVFYKVLYIFLNGLHTFLQIHNAFFTLRVYFLFFRIIQVFLCKEDVFVITSVEI